jgi:hypothetical protein
MDNMDTREANSAQANAEVKKKTGRTWHEWFALLDRDGAARLDRRGIIRIIAGKYGIGLRWRRAIATAYEQAHTTRESEEHSSGLAANAARTIQAPIRALSATIHDVEARARRLKSRALGGRSPGTMWSRASSSAGNVDVSGDRFDAVRETGSPRSEITGDPLPDTSPVEKMRAFWKARVDSLQKSLARKPVT